MDRPFKRLGVALIRIASVGWFVLAGIEVLRGDWLGAGILLVLALLAWQ